MEEVQLEALFMLTQGMWVTPHLSVFYSLDTYMDTASYDDIVFSSDDHVLLTITEMGCSHRKIFVQS